jgi:hypothetical protein
MTKQQRTQDKSIVKNIKEIYTKSLNSNNIIDLINNKNFKVNNINKLLCKKERILLNCKYGKFCNTITR